MTPLDDRNWQPATFADRGVAVPFTSPLLGGARVRLAERRCDILVPHPGGARGVYIFALASLSEFCAPTLHDSRLAERLANLRPLSPATVRQASRAVAAEGTAGRAAASTALAATARDAQSRERYELLLLQALVRQGSAEAGISSEHRTAGAVLKLADRIGRDADAVRADIGLLAGVLAGAGLDGVASDGTILLGRCSLLLDRIEAMRAGIQSWAGAAGADTACTQVAACALAIRSAGRLVMTAAQKLLEDPAALLGVWATNPDIVTARLCRPDWFLDGWEHLCLLWHVAQSDDQKAEAVSEACALLPPMPPEADGWLPRPEVMAPLRARHAIAGGASGRAATRPPNQVVILVARNERIRALAA